MGKEDVYVLGSVIRQFITEASEYDMPTRFLDRVRKEYHFTSSSDNWRTSTGRPGVKGTRKPRRRCRHAASMTCTIQRSRGRSYALRRSTWR